MIELSLEFIRLAVENIELIKNSPTESLQKKDFRFDLVNGVRREDLITFLVAQDFIETESDESIFFLTPWMYEIEDVEAVIWNCLEPSLQEKLAESLPVDEGIQKTEEEIQASKARVESKELDRRIGRHTSVIIIVLFFSWGLHLQRQRRPKIEKILEQINLEDLKQQVQEVQEKRDEELQQQRREGAVLHRE